MAFNISFNQSLSNPITTDPLVILSNIRPLLILIIGIVIYAIFIFKFYKYLAKRDILIKQWNAKYDWQGGIVQKFFKTIFYLLEYVILIPIIIFFWFIILTTILVFLSDNSPEQIMLISMAIIGAVRITSYYKMDLSSDLAKMIPFTLLGFFILDMQFFSFDKFISNTNYMFTLIDKLVFYLLCVVAIEFVMRVQQLIRNEIRRQRGISTIEETERRIEKEVLEREKKERREKARELIKEKEKNNGKELDIEL